MLIKYNKKAFTMLEVLIVIAMISLFSIPILGTFTSFFNNENDINTMIMSKIELEKSIGKRTPIDGYKNIPKPYLLIKNNNILFTTIAENDSSLFEENKEFMKENDKSVTISVIGNGIGDNKIYFNKMGQPINKYNQITDISIVITKKLIGYNHTTTINLDKLGNLSYQK